MAASTPKKLLEVKLPFARDTKGTHVFATDNPDAKIRNVYVVKGALGDTTPSEITLTVSA